MLEVIQTAALVIIALSVGFYILNIRIIINPTNKDTIKELNNLISTLQQRCKNYDRTVDNMNNYQEKLSTETATVQKLKAKILELELYIINDQKNSNKVLRIIEDFKIDQYEKGTPCQ